MSLSATKRLFPFGKKRSALAARMFVLRRSLRVTKHNTPGWQPECKLKLISVVLLGKKISPWAAIYIVAGILVCILNLAHADAPDLHRFILYLVCANVATLGLTLSGGSGLVPAGLLVMLLGVEDLSLPEILFIAFTVTLLNEGRKARKLAELAPVLYGVATITIGFATAQYTYKLTSSLNLYAIFPAPLIASSFVLLFNCGLAATLFQEPRRGEKSGPFLGVYRKACRPLLPWFVAAAYLAYLIRSTSLHTGIHPGLIALPILFALDRGYRAWSYEKTTHRKELENMYRQTLETLGLAIDSRDQMNQSQPRRVRIYAAAVGRELKLSETELQNLDTAALLHDIGKLGIPDYILMKPSALTAEEWEKMKTHPTLGAEMLSRMNYPEAVLSIVRAYRERWDGKGYPRGLSGKDIPIGARILAAVDTLDALASDRPYRGAMPLRKAITTLRSERGKSLDPEIVYILEQHYEELEAAAWAASGKTPPTAGLQLSVTQPQEEAGTPQVRMLASPGNVKGSVADPIALARQETQLMQALSGDLANCLRVEDVLEAVHKRLSQLVSHDTAAIFCARGENIELVAVAGPSSHLFSKSAVAIQNSLSGRVLESRSPVINGDIRQEPCYSNDSLVLQRLQSALAVPFEGENQVQGVLALYHPDRNAFKREELRVVQAASLHAGRALENALKYQNAAESAVTDHLTGVPNARSLAIHLQRELARASREESTLGVLVCDLDGFKGVNDRFGHLTGNEVLQRVAKGLTSVCRGSDYLARMGGDEFVIVLPGVTDEIGAEQTERLRSVALETGWSVCNEECLSMSVGVAVYPLDGTDTQTLLAEADRRMYADKQKRKAEKRREIEEGSRVVA